MPPPRILLNKIIGDHDRETLKIIARRAAERQQLCDVIEELETRRAAEVTWRAAKTKAKTKTLIVWAYEHVPHPIIGGEWLPDYNAAFAGMYDAARGLAWAWDNHTIKMIVSGIQGLNPNSLAHIMTMNRTFIKNLSPDAKLHAGTIVALTPEGLARIQSR